MVLGLFKSKKQRKEESNRKKLEASVKTGKKLGGRSGSNIAKKAQAKLDAPAKAKALENVLVTIRLGKESISFIALEYSFSFVIYS